MALPIRSKAAASLVAAVAIALLTACSGGGTTDSAAVAGGDSGAVGTGVAYAKAQLKKYEVTRDAYGTPVSVPKPPELHGKTVWYVPIGTGVPVLATIGTQMQNALGRLGASVHVCDGKFQPTTIADCMNTAATQGASAVVTGFVDYASAPSAFQSLVGKGIPVLVGGVPVTGGAKPGKNLGFFDPSGLTQQAFRLMSDAAIADSDGKAKALVVKLTDSSVTTKNNEVGIEELKQHCPKCEVTTVDTLTADMSRLGSAISAKLAANPDIDYLILPQDAFLQAALPGIQSAGFTNKLKVIAAGGTTAGLRALKAGQLAYNVGQGAVYNGWGFADATVRLLAGAPIQPENDGAIRVFTKDNVGGLDLSDANYNGTAWYGGDRWQRDFLTAWGVKS
ncbi:sugar ABC transporter substrate-binding protein [Actinoallomurus sp. CA-142502]|uniref:sugar ABC transporter substrate-binding protein n=1 Tax=Actinoallomurus sp. CA-142502 TaxID=3239885 RepID=UPI003D927FB8